MITVWIKSETAKTDVKQPTMLTNRGLFAIMDTGLCEAHDRMVYRVDVSHVSQFLRGVDIFQGLSERHPDRISSLCEERSFEPGELFALSDVPDSAVPPRGGAEV